MTDSRYELLAPAGDEECLRAAVANGADAVYFGLEDFNARRRAANFTLAGLPAVMDWLHRHNVRGYVAFNTLVFSDELPRAAEFVRGIIEAGADAMIVQDLGIAALARRMSATFPVHASTQTTQTHPAGMAVLAELGIRRVILARELSLVDITRIREETALELEAFVHGSLCISYSGQCLASESLWGRSGNRGMCGQACRLPYTLVVDGREQPSPAGDYLLSPHDLGTYARIPELMRAGVTSFKIEGRLKSAQYVACIARVYREAIDAAVAGAPYSPSRERQEELAQAFSRGLTDGYLDGPRHQELIGRESPKSRGVRIGTVVDRTPRGVVVLLDADGCDSIKPGDGVVFDGGSTQTEAQGGRVYSAEPAGERGSPASGGSHRREAGGRVRWELTFGRGDVDLRKIRVGDAVFKTDDPAIGRRLEATWSRDVVVRPVAVQAEVAAVVGEPMRLVLADDDGNRVEVRSDEPLAAALRHPLSRDLLRDQLGRLGDTPFELRRVELIGPTGPADSVSAMAPKSVINQLRRAAAQALLAARLSAMRHRVDVSDALARLREALPGPTPATDPGGRPRLHVLVRDLEQLEAACRLSGAGVPLGTVYADLRRAEEYGPAVQIARASKTTLGLATPQVIHPGENDLLDAVARASPDVVLVRNLAALNRLRPRLPAAEFVGDFSLNAANELTAGVLLARGLTRVTAGHDLNVSQIAALAGSAGGAAVELVVHAHLPLFITAHCIAAASLSKGDDCRSCGGPCERHAFALRDRNSEDHPLLVDVAGRSVVFNAVSQSIVAVWPQVASLPVRHWRVELLTESPEAAKTLIGLYARLAAGDQSALDELRKTDTRARAGTLEHA